jgi:hypothetical protein
MSIVRCSSGSSEFLTQRSREGSQGEFTAFPRCSRFLPIQIYDDNFIVTRPGLG